MSNIYHKNFRPSPFFLTLRLSPSPLDSEMGWTKELWTNLVFLLLQNKYNNWESSILQELLLCPLYFFFFGKMLFSKMLFSQRAFLKRAFCQGK